MLDVNATKELHASWFGDRPRIFAAPGRVNLIGEHTDYADGFVMPAAIDFATLAAISARSDKQAVIYSENYGEEVSRHFDAIGTRGQHHWSDYPLGVLATLQQEGI